MTRRIILIPFLCCMAMLITTSAFSAHFDLQITGVLDGTLPGGEPKVAELFARTNIPDLSLYAVNRAGNGGAFDSPITAAYILPAISLNAGDFYYAVGNGFVDQTGVFDTVFPGKSRSRNSGVNSNGDDVTAIFYDPAGLFAGAEVQGDTVGELGVDGSGTAWEHLDSWIYSKNGRAPTTDFLVANWNVLGANALDGADAAGIAASFPDGTYAIPEPTSFVLLFAGLMGIAGTRRR